VQVQASGLPATEGCYSAWRALIDAGWDVRPFKHHEDIDVVEDEPVFGGIPNVVGALTRLGVELPDIDYPMALRGSLLDPEISTATMGDVRQSVDRWPAFIKPTTGRKEFTGLVVRAVDDLLKVTHVDDALPVYCGRAFDLRGRVEWRAFIINGSVRDIRPYTGCPNGGAPSQTFLQMLANSWSSAPAGYAIDVVDIGTATAPDWRVIECNDGYCLGSYGFHRAECAKLLVTRWAQLTRGNVCLA
jgi:hypothetical protein